MSTMLEKVNYISGIKDNIAKAITDKGGTVTNDFDSYATAITNLPSGGGSSAASLDFGEIGYVGNETHLNQEREKLAYSKQKYNEWDPTRTDASDLYENDTKLIYAPKIDTSKVTSMSSMFSKCSSLTSVPQFDTSNVTNMSSMFSKCSSLTSVPQFDTSKVTVMIRMFESCPSLTSAPPIDLSSCISMSEMFYGYKHLIEVEFINPPQLNCDMNSLFHTYNSETGLNIYLHVPNDWSYFISKVPSKHKIHYLGDIDFNVRVLDNDAWLTGEQNLTLSGQPCTYVGNGVYNTKVNIPTKEASKSFNGELKLGDTVMGNPKVTSNTQDVISNNNPNSITTKTGQQIIDLAISNDGWTYSEEVGGVISKKITSDQSTEFKIQIASNDFTIDYGQESESNYDYCDLYDGSGNLIKSFKGEKTTLSEFKTFSGTSSDNILNFKYHKDGGGDQGKDAFWIKKLSYTELPPYPVDK